MLHASTIQSQLGIKMGFSMLQLLKAAILPLRSIRNMLIQGFHLIGQLTLNLQNPFYFKLSSMSQQRAHGLK